MTDLSVIRSPKCLAVIPARGGSKGLPGKNLKEIGGKTLVARAVEAARATDLFAKIVLSTDDPEIAAEGRRAGADVPCLRPAELASDTANILDVVRQLLDTIRSAGEPFYDVVALVEPTSPARTPGIVVETVMAACSEGADAALTVSEVPHRYHSRKQLERDASGFAVHVHQEGASIINRQQLSASFIRNGMCYAVRTSALATGHGMIGSRARLLLVAGPVINIDDQSDLDLARQVLALRGDP